MNHQAVTERVNLTFQDYKSNEVELPLKILVLSDLTADERSQDISENNLITIENGVSNLLASQNVVLKLTLENKLNPSNSESLSIDYDLSSLEDFDPESLLTGIPELNNAFSLYKQLGNDHIKFSRFSGLLSEFGFNAADSIEFNERLVMQHELHQRMNEQLNLIIQNKRFRSLESSWRSLSYLDEHLNYKENIELVVLNTNKQALLEDFEDAPDVIQSTLFQFIYSAEFGQFGGRPYSLLLGDFDFSHQSQDMALLQNLAKVAAISHCPLISAAADKMFGVDQFSDFSRIRDISAHFEQPFYAKWNSFREHSDSRYVCLTLPKFLLRPSHTNSGQGFNYQEKTTSETKGLWGNSAYALVTRFANSYANFRWFINVSGEQYGQLNDLKVESGSPTMRAQLPTEVLISERSANELIKNGFTPLSIQKAAKNAVFMAVPSCKSIETHANTAEGRQLALNQQIETQLPYMLISCRFSQYIKVMQRENIGSWLTRSQIDQSLNRWLKQFVSDMDNPAPSVRARRPLRNANISVRDMDGKSGWFLSTISITPHFKYMGQSFTLTERSRLDKA
ncbi:MAG: type VI secretion system protein ImpC [Psychrobacter glaciei]|jgi:type VI secretion system protein ImpC